MPGRRGVNGRGAARESRLGIAQPPLKIALGRDWKLVSLVDFEVEAARYGGVLQARAKWAWDQAEDSAVLEVWLPGAKRRCPPRPPRRTLRRCCAAP